MLALHSGSNSAADRGGRGGRGGQDGRGAGQDGRGDRGDRGGGGGQGGRGAYEGSGVAGGIVDDSPARRTRQRLAEASHAGSGAGTGTAQLLNATIVCRHRWK